MSESDSNPDLSYDQTRIRNLLKGEEQMCKNAANKFFANESSFKAKNLWWTVLSIALTFFAGVLNIGNGIWGADLSNDESSGMLFAAAVASMLAGVATAIISANDWQGKAQAAETAAVTYNKVSRDIIMLLAAEGLTDADLTGVQKDIEYAGQMTPNILEKFNLTVAGVLEPKPSKKSKGVTPTAVVVDSRPTIWMGPN